MKNFIKMTVISLFLVVLQTENATAGQLFAGGTMLHSMLERNLISRNAKPPEMGKDPYIILKDKSLRVSYIKTPAKQMYATAESGVCVREGYSVDSLQVGSVMYGQGIEVDGITPNREWYHTSNGYVSAEYLSENRPEEKITQEVIKNATEQTTYAEESTDDDQPAGGYMGTFKITYYCPCAECNGGRTDGLTVSGVCMTPYYTVAADPSVIPLGSVIYINGSEYKVEDTGVSGNVLDVLVESHQEALDRGVDYAEVYTRK